MDISGSTLVALNYTSASGLDTAVYIGGSQIKSMLTSDRLAVVVPSLAANGTDTSTLYLGYSPAQTTFPIIVGNNGYITTADAANLELGNSFNVTVNGYYNTAASNATMLGKTDAFRLYGTGGTVTAELTVENVASANYTATDHRLTSEDPDYATVRGMANAEYKDGAGLSIYEDLSAGGYHVGRSEYRWIIAALPGGSTVSSSKVWWYGLTVSGVTPSTGYLLDGTGLTWDAVGDYGVIGGKGLADQRVYIAGLVNGVWSSHTVNAAGVSEIPTSGGNVTWAARVSEELNGVVPISANQYHIVPNGEPKLEITYTYPAASIQLTATGVTQGEHAFTVATTGGNATLYVDGVAQDTDSLSASQQVQANSNNWTWVESNVMPYANSLSITTNGTQRLLYQPNTMIIGSTLPDRSSNGNDGTITWGTNSNIIVAAGSFGGGLSVATASATNVEPTSATLNGALLNTGNNSQVSVNFQWGMSVVYDRSTTPQTMTAVGGFSATVTGLQPNTTYHFRAQAIAGSASAYGYDYTFTTPAQGGGSTVIQFGGGNARVFENYIATGDLLFVAEVQNKYTPYYPNQSPREHFTIELIGVDNTTLIAASPLQDWGDKPVSIYLRKAMADNITRQGAYHIRMQANFASNVSADYQLEPKDWKGADLVKLDDWAIYVAYNMQTYDQTGGYITILTDRKQAITDAVGGYFTAGIPGIGQIRPNLFTTSQIKATMGIGTSNDTWDSSDAWSTNVGPSIAADAAVMAAPLGLTGRDFLAGGTLLISLAVIGFGTATMGGFGALGLFLISIPIVWLSTYFRIFPVIPLLIIIIFFGWMAIRQFFIKTT